MWSNEPSEMGEKDQLNLNSFTIVYTDKEFKWIWDSHSVKLYLAHANVTGIVMTLIFLLVCKYRELLSFCLSIGACVQNLIKTIDGSVCIHFHWF